MLITDFKAAFGQISRNFAGRMSGIRDKRLIGIWLLTGVFMIYIQIVIGGITRLTGSGLSIAKWEVVTGTIPPLNQQQWEEEFAVYQATPQYQKINQGMTLSQFKDIYFWEWFHRLWGRVLGVVFLIPFVWFIAKKKLNKPLIRKAIVAFLLGGLVGIFGWIMVMSGLQDRPMVSPYRLAMHLSLALLTYGYIFWVALQLLIPKATDTIVFNRKNYLWALWLLVLVVVQIEFGALVSGMKAALFYPTWPDMNGFFIPPVLQNLSNWEWSAFVHFDQNPFAGAFVQFFHRMIAYLLFVLIGWFGIKLIRQNFMPKIAYLLLGLLITQVLLGIFTLINSVSTIPVVLGVLHQAVAILLMTTLLYLVYRLRPK